MNKSIILLLSALIGACAPSRFIKPLEKNEKAVSANIGGPTLNYGFPVPLPLTAISYAKGIDTNFTVFGSLHLTSLLFGNFQIDAGATYLFHENKNCFIPSISGSLNGNLIWDIEDSKFKFWPQIDLNGYWEFGKKKHFVYLGISNWFELTKLRSHEQESLSRWIYNPQLGTIIKSGKLQYQIEVKYLAPNFNNEYSFVSFYSINNKGSLGLYLSIYKTF